MIEVGIIMGSNSDLPVMQQAAENGTPFCEQCEKAKAAK